ncbi:MAG: NADH:ubiquinone reductase (Na(+)-transporting) subunit C [Crocinitomicaceae bacterium]
MAINKESNGYTIGFAIVLVVVVGTILAAVSMGLKPIQQKNAAKKKRMDILGAIKIESTRQNVDDVFKKHIVDGYIIDAKGKKIEGKTLEDAEKLDIQKQFRNSGISPEDRQYPLFIAEKEGQKLFIIPMVGKGLWGPIWGYVAVKENMVDIQAAKFDHKTETPGLGAEIKVYKSFQKQFEDNKKISDDNGEFVKITVTKGSGASGNPHAVDGITGGTITSKGVEEMMERTLKVYVSHFHAK